MLTITTNKEEIVKIAHGEIKEKPLPLSDFWTTRIINLLGFSDKENREILHNLRNNRTGTTDAKRQVKFTAGGAMSVCVTAHFRIGRINEEAAETFILTVDEVLQTKGLETTTATENPEKVNSEVVEEAVAGMPNAPAVRVMSEHTGFCKYCKQARIISAPEGLSGEDYNELATEDCECNEARTQRERRAKMKAAGMWAQNVFSKNDGQLQLVLCAIRATFEGTVDYVTIKIGKNTHKVDRDSDGMIRIKTVYRDSNEETF